MRRHMLVAAAVGFLSLPTYADEAACVTNWMKMATDSKTATADNTTEIKNFGEKFCGCVAKQPAEIKADMKKAIPICWSRTLLHVAMDTVGDEVGLTEAKDSDVSGACASVWVKGDPAPQHTDKEKKMGEEFCQCAQPKLMDVLKKSDDMTDQEYAESIDTVADSCKSVLEVPAK